MYKIFKVQIWFKKIIFFMYVVICLLLVSSTYCLTNSADSKLCKKKLFLSNINVLLVSSLQFLRTYWSLDSTLGWPDPGITDPCDNQSQFPGISCLGPPAALRIVELYPFFLKI